MNQKFSYMIFLLITLLALPVRGQETFEKMIQMDYSSSGNSITQTTDGNFIVGCRVNRTDASDGYIAPVIIKINQHGDLLWSRKISQDIGWVHAVAASLDGGCFIIAPSPTDITGESYSTLTKIDSSGHTLWRDYFQAVGLGLPSKIIALSNGGCVVATDQSGGVMWVDSNGKVQLNTQLHSGASINAVLTSITKSSDGSIGCVAFIQYYSHEEILKFSSSGKLLWERQMPSEIALDGIESTSDGGFAICGSLKKDKLSTRDAVISKFDSAGNYLWGISIDAFGQESLSSITQASNGNLIATGTRGNNTLFVRVNQDGSVQSIKEISIPTEVTSTAQLIRTSDKGFALTGISGGAAMIMKLDSNVNGCHINDLLYNVQSIKKPTDSILFFSTNDTIDYGYSTSDNSNSIAYTEIDLCNISSVLPSITEENDISLFPNPITANEPLTISLTSSFRIGSYSISLLNLLGNTLKNEKINLTGAKQDILFKMPECPAGVYYIELQSENGVVMKAKFVKE